MIVGDKSFRVTVGGGCVGSSSHSPASAATAVMALPWYCTCEQAARATASEVAGVLETDPDRGLDPATEVERRRKVHGLNQARSL